MTAHAMKGDRERCLEAGMDDYLSKPISPQALAQTIEKWLAKSEAGPGTEEGIKVRGSGQPRTARLPDGTEDKKPTPIFDRPALVDRLMGDEALVEKIVACFLEDMPNQIRTLRTHIGAGDAKLAGGQAHSIKGAAANVGGMALSAAAFAMEQAGKAGRLDTMAALMPELERQFELLREAMKRTQKEE